MSKLVIGIIGAGELTQSFYIPILKEQHNVEIIAISDNVKNRSKILAERFEIPFVFDNYHEMLEIESINAIMISSSLDQHYQLAKDALNAGKNIFVEKPFMLDSKQAEEITNLANELDLKIMIGVNQRFRYDARLMKNYVTNGEIGKTVYIKTGWIQKNKEATEKSNPASRDSNLMFDLALPLIDSILWIYDFKKVKSVRASISNRFDPNIIDLCIGSIYFEDGTVGTLEVAWAINSDTNYYFDVYGIGGSIQTNPIKLQKNNGDILKPQQALDKLANISLHRKSFEFELKHFASSLLNNLPIISTGEQASIVMKILENMILSAKLNKEIEI